MASVIHVGHKIVGDKTLARGITRGECAVVIPEDNSYRPELPQSLSAINSGITEAISLSLFRPIDTYKPVLHANNKT